MAKEQLDTVYRIVDVVGVSEKSWEDAGRNAVETAAESLRDLRVAEVTKMDMKVENGKVTAFRTRVSLSFKYENLNGPRAQTASPTCAAIVLMNRCWGEPRLCTPIFLRSGMLRMPSLANNSATRPSGWRCRRLPPAAARG